MCGESPPQQRMQLTVDTSESLWFREVVAAVVSDLLFAFFFIIIIVSTCEIKLSGRPCNYHLYLVIRFNFQEP